MEDGVKAVPHVTSAKPWLSAGLQLPLESGNRFLWALQ